MVRMRSANAPAVTDISDRCGARRAGRRSGTLQSQELLEFEERSGR